MPDASTAQPSDVQEPPSRPAQVGLIVMSSDESGDAGFRLGMPEDVIVFATRAGVDDAAFERGRYVLAPEVHQVVDTLPAQKRLDAIAFSCTSGTVLTGEEVIRQQIAEARPNLPVATPPSAAIAAFQRRDVTRIAILSPYPRPVHEEVVRHFKGAGVDVVADRFLTFADETDPPALQDAFVEAATQIVADNPGAEGLFISCTAVPVVPLLPQLERDLGIPVFSSSQVLAQQTLSLLGRPVIAGGAA